MVELELAGLEDLAVEDTADKAVDQGPEGTTEDNLAEDTLGVDTEAEADSADNFEY